MFEGRADSFEIWPYCALQTTVRMVPHWAIVQNDAFNSGIMWYQAHCRAVRS